jgi:HK97 family phage portal protein
MRVFGYNLTLTKALPLPPRSPGGGGWWPIVREPYTGAWQKNDEALNPANVLSNPTVFRCYSLITTDIGKTPLRLVEHDGNDIWTETINPAFSPVLRRPNPYQNPQQFYEAWTGSKLLYGNTYVLKERDSRGVVRARYVLDPLKVRPLVAPDGAVYYELQQNDLAGVANEPRPIVPASEISHDRWNCLFHPLVGVSPLYACGGAAVQALKIQDNSTAFFANNSQPSGIVLVPGAPSDEQMQRMQTAWKAARGDLNRGGTAFLTEGQKYEAVTQTATDSQLTEQMRQIANTIAGVWGVPISMVDSSQQPPYANSEATQLQYRSQCLQTLMTAIENCLDEDVPDPYGTEFDIDALIWMDTATKTQAARDAIGSGAMAPNEARSKYFGLGPVTGGDTPYLQAQYQSLEAAAERDALGPPPAPVKAPAPLAEELV